MAGGWWFFVFFFLIRRSCGYDYVELIAGDNDEGPRYCGDKSDVLKLTRFVTKTPKLRIHFVSDYSHSFSGFKARVSAEHGKIKSRIASTLHILIARNFCFFTHTCSQQRVR